MQTLQCQFEKSLLDSQANDLAFIASNHKRERLNIYRQTVMDHCRAALAQTFPGIWALLGKECADNVARLFCQEKENLPTTGCLEDWGSTFPQYLTQIKALTALPYLQDVALYEWYKQLSYTAPETEVFLLQSNFPLQAIIQLIDNPSLPEVNLNQGKAWALIVRDNYQVITHWLSEQQWYQIRAIAHAG